MKQFLALPLLLCGITLHAQTNAIYTNLPVGRYSVGFKIITLTDSFRVTKPLYNYFGEKDTTDRYRKISIHLWYPARPNSGKGRITYGEYGYNHILTSTNEAIPAGRKEGLLKNVRENLQGFFGNITDDDWTKLSETAFLAQKDAPPVNQKFPLLIGVLRQLSTSVTNEVMASNGYVIAMIVGEGIDYPLGYIPEVADMQQAMTFIGKTGMIDENRIGTYGFSGSGFTQVLLAMQDPRVGALADLESGLYMQGLWDHLSKSNFYNAQKLTIPFLHLFSRDLSKEEINIGEFENNLKYSERYRVLLNQPGLHHWDFATEGRVSSTVLHLRGEKEPGIRATFELANIYLLHFFNAVLKNEKASHDILQVKERISSYPDSAWTFRHYSAIKSPPDKNQFAEIINRKGIDTAVVIARRVFVVDSAAELVNESTLMQLASDYRRQQKPNEALVLMKLNAELHPGVAWVWNNLASMQEDFGDKQEAIRCSEKVLKILEDLKGQGPSFNERVGKSAAERIERLKK